MTTELVFTKIDSGYGYEAFATVDADFNIHLERNDIGNVMLYQSTVENGKKNLQYNNYNVGEVFDMDFANIVYPKHIRIISSSLVQKGYVTEKEG